MNGIRCASFSHPDYTVGPGIAPGPPSIRRRSRKSRSVARMSGSRTDKLVFGSQTSCVAESVLITAGWDFHPAPKVSCNTLTKCYHSPLKKATSFPFRSIVRLIPALKGLEGSPIQNARRLLGDRALFVVPKLRQSSGCMPPLRQSLVSRQIVILVLQLRQNVHRLDMRLRLRRADLVDVGI